MTFVDLLCYIKQTTVTIIILYRVATELLYITKVPLHVVRNLVCYYRNVCDSWRRYGEGLVTGSGRGRRRRRRQLTEMTHNTILHTCIISLLESCAS